MASAQLQPIYNRLNGVSTYHPYTADTFNDWSMEAGDIVTVSRNGVNYASPVHNSTVKWNGKQKVFIESRGEKERGPVAKMSIRDYNYGNGGGNGFRGGARKNTEDKLRDTAIWKNEEAITLEAWDRRNADEEHTAALKVQAERISAEVKTRKANDEELSGKIEVEAGKISQIVQAVGANGQVTAASIVMAINNGASSVQISASRISLDGTTTLNSVMTVGSGHVIISRPLQVSSYIRTESVQLRDSGRSITLTGTNMASAVRSVKVSGNVLTLERFDGTSVDFSKATTLTGAWSGNLNAGKSYKVEARQAGSTNPVATHYSPQLDDYYTGSRYWSGSRLMLPVTAYDEKGTDVMRKDVDVTAVYNAGASSVTPETHTYAGKFTYYGAISVEGVTYTGYITRDTSARWDEKRVYV